MSNQSLTGSDRKSWLRTMADLCTPVHKPQLNRQQGDNAGHRAGPTFLPAAAAENAIVIDERAADTAAMPPCYFNPGRRPSIDEMSATFCNAWRKTTQEIFTIASMCDYMDRTYNGAEKNDLIEKLPVDRTRFDKLAKLGRDQRLRSIADRLPPSESTLCILSRFADDELAAALEAGIIHPGATRAAIAAWLAEYRVGRVQNRTTAKVVTFAVIRLRPNVPQELVREVNGTLKRLHELADVEVSYPKSDAWLRPRVRQLVAETKAARLADRPHHISQTDWLRQQWPFGAKDVAIGRRTRFKRMRAIADRIGQAQAFAAILEQACPAINRGDG